MTPRTFSAETPGTENTQTTVKPWIQRLSKLVGLMGVAAIVAVACNDHPVETFDDYIVGERQDAVDLARPKVDVLWVIDNSQSMAEEQGFLRDNFNLFIDEMTATGADFRLAVVTTDIKDPQQSGRFQNVPDGRGLRDSPGVDVSPCGDQPAPLVLRSADYRDNRGALDVTALKRDFGCNATVGINGDGYEAGLEAARVALSPELLQGHNAGFLRDDAHLAIIFISDENDCSHRGSLSADGGGNACEWYAETQLVPVEEYIEKLGALKPDHLKVIVTAIIAPDSGARTPVNQRVQASCVSADTGEAYAGWRYDQVINALGGTTANICNGDFGGALEEVATAVGSALRDSCLSGVPACDDVEACVQVDLVRPLDAPPIEGLECEVAAGGTHQVCTLQINEDYFIDTQAACGVAVTLARQPGEQDRILVRYPQ